MVTVALSACENSIKTLRGACCGRAKWLKNESESDCTLYVRAEMDSKSSVSRVTFSILLFVTGNVFFCVIKKKKKKKKKKAGEERKRQRQNEKKEKGKKKKSKQGRESEV